MDYSPPPPVKVVDLASGLRAIVDRPRLLTEAYQRQQWQAVVEGAHPDIVEFRRVFINKMAKVHGVPLWAHNMVRTAEEQTALYVRGVSKSVAGKSPHNYGLAVDIVHSVKAWEMDDLSWSMIGHIGLEVSRSIGVPIRWGGDWDGDGGKVDWDPAHWELADWQSLKSGYPLWGWIDGKPIGENPQRIWVRGKRLPLPKKASA